MDFLMINIQFIYCQNQDQKGNFIKFQKKKKEFQKIWSYLSLVNYVKPLNICMLQTLYIEILNLKISFCNMELLNYDFGWAVNKGGELRNTFCRTPLYVSPQILQRPQLNNNQQKFQDIVFPSDLNISNEAKNFVLKILKKNKRTAKGLKIS